MATLSQAISGFSGTYYLPQDYGRIGKIEPQRENYYYCIPWLTDFPSDDSGWPELAKQAFDTNDDLGP